MPHAWRRGRIAVSWLFLSFLAALAIGSPGLARAGECATAQAKEAERAVSRLKTWKDLHAYFKAFRDCDDGEYADLISAAVINLMTVQWSDLQSGANQIVKDPQFSQFVLAHIDTTADAGDLKKIVNNASRKCPMVLMLLCLEIKQVAKAAAK